MDPETIDPLLSALPAPWLAAIEAYAPHVLAWLLAITVIVHLLVPISRAVERWAVASSVTWDDGPAHRFVEIIEWLSKALRAVLAYLPRLAIGGLGQRDPKPENVSQRHRTMRPPPPDAGALGVALLIVAAALSSIMASGCSTRALGVQADLVALGGIAAAGADEVLVEARERELDAVLEQAREECAPAGCDEERAEHHRAELAAAEARWAPVLACRAPVVEALRSWADGISTALQVATDDVGIALLLRLGGRFVAAYSALVGCVEAAAPDVDLPGLPPALSALVGDRS